MEGCHTGSSVVASSTKLNMSDFADIRVEANVLLHDITATRPSSQMNREHQALRTFSYDTEYIFIGFDA
jgi:hypothetical protein